MAKDYSLQLDETIRGNIHQDTLNSLIQITIASIGTEVSWDHFDREDKIAFAHLQTLNH